MKKVPWIILNIDYKYTDFTALLTGIFTVAPAVKRAPASNTPVGTGFAAFIWG